MRSTRRGTGSMGFALVVTGLAVACAVKGLPADAAPPSGHTHTHPTQGPHHGALIELGREDYHAELVHEEAADTVTIYILDGAAREAVAIDARELTLNLMVGGKPQQFRLTARPQPTDPAGKSSAFGSTSAPMCRSLDAKGTTGRVNVDVLGKRFVGKLVGHSHDHAH